MTSRLSSERIIFDQFRSCDRGDAYLNITLIYGMDYIVNIMVLVVVDYLLITNHTKVQLVRYHSSLRDCKEGCSVRLKIKFDNENSNYRRSSSIFCAVTLRNEIVVIRSLEKTNLNVSELLFVSQRTKSFKFSEIYD